MLKIEVIKFEAQDIITSSVAAPDAPVEDVEPAECICPKNADHFDELTETWNHGDCQAESHPHCISNVN
jgi:hypothetical protein